MNAIVELPPLTPDEDTFCLAVIEYGGNLGAAYKAAFGADQTLPIARARELITRPEVAKRIHALTLATEEHALVSLGSHLVKLAEIRDVAIDNMQLKTALDAEVKRGEVAGFYHSKTPTKPTNPGEGGPMVQINIGSSSANIQDWAKQQGHTPLVIDVNG